MLKKTIAYTNPFTEQEVSEDHYFHISKADLVEMEMEEHKAEYTAKSGEKFTGMQAKLQRIVDSEDGKAIMAEFKDIIRRAYGKKDGDRFLKSKEIWEDFSSTEAFSQLLFDLCTNAASAAEFVNGVLPGNIDQIAAEVKAQAVQTTTEAPSAVPAIAAHDEAEEALGAPATSDIPDEEAKKPVTLTRAEAVDMDADQLQSGLASGRYKLS